MNSAEQLTVHAEPRLVAARKFELGAALLAFDRGAGTGVVKTDVAKTDAVKTQLVKKAIVFPDRVESAFDGITFDALVALATVAFKIVLYRNSYQSAFDVPVVDVHSHKPAEMSLRFSRFDIDNESSFREFVARDEYADASGIDAADVAVVVVGAGFPPASPDQLFSVVPPVTLLIEWRADGAKLSWLHWLNDPVAGFVERLHAHLLRVLECLVSDPDVPPLSIDILSPAEVATQSRLLTGEVVVREFVPLYRRVDAMARAHPDAVAVRFGSSTLSYLELVRCSAQLAEGLRRADVCQGDRVAVLMTPCEDVIVAILAIHRAGAVYVPIDPTFPAERIAAVLQECAPTLILANVDTSAVGYPWTPLVWRVSELLYEPDDVFAGADLQPDDGSHIFFTSGTTGRPKGVVSTHANLFHYLDAAVSRYGIGAQDRFVAAARFTFSISLFELLAPLVAGASVTILPREVVLDLPQLAAAIETATAFHFGPSLLKRLLPYIEENYPSLTVFEHMRHVSSGGDMVPPDVLEALKRVFTNAEVFVIYGCSEISCMGCTAEITRSERVARTQVGRPHQNTSLRIMDVHGNRVPLGVPGIVHFAGPGLVSGYLGQPKLTAQKFAVIDGVRHYETGDIGRVDAQGNLELLGRHDFQAKIRGIRIELPEVEKWLKEHPAIADCVVMAKHVGTGEASLVAYIVVREAVTSTGIQEFLAQKVPDYMIPSIYVRLDALPVNHNAKLDRLQLPDPHRGNMLLSAEFEKSRDDIESHLIKVWESLFGVSGIGIDHNFFELGGDSLRAVQVLTEIAKTYRKRIPIGALLRRPTVRGLAAELRSEARADAASIVTLKQGASDRPPVFFLYAALLYRDLAAALNLDRTLYGIYLPEDIELVEKGVESEAFRICSDFSLIVRRYLELIRGLQPTGPYALCGHSFGGLIALEVARELRRQGETVELLAMIDTWRPGFRHGMATWEKAVEHVRMIGKHGVSYLWSRLGRRCAGVLKRAGSKPVAAGSEPSAGPNTAPVAVDVRDLARTMASNAYRPAAYAGRVLLFRAERRADFQPLSRYLGWEGILSGIDLHRIQGTHMSMMTKGNVETIAARMEEAASGKTGSRQGGADS